MPAKITEECVSSELTRQEHDAAAAAVDDQGQEPFLQDWQLVQNPKTKAQEMKCMQCGMVLVWPKNNYPNGAKKNHRDSNFCKINSGKNT